MSFTRIVVKARGAFVSNLPAVIDISPTSPLSSIYTVITKSTALPEHRLRITKGYDGSVVDNVTTTTVEGAGLQDDSVIFVKDLGPQLAWRTVYIIEYLGPLIMHPLFLYALRPHIYAHGSLPPSTLQQLLCVLLTVHFTKRELETIFVHTFSLATMPARNIFRNSAHYWLLGGLNIAYWVFSPTSSLARPTEQQNMLLVHLGLALFVIGECANFHTHLTLKRLREKAGTTTARAIPSGFGFSWVTCPNYFFEVVAWLGMWLVSGLNWSVITFTLVGSTTMYVWAKGKEKRYRKLFGDKYKKKRFVLFPGLL